MVQHAAVLEPVVPFISEARTPQGGSVPHLDFEDRTITPTGPLVVLSQTWVLREICDVEGVHPIIVLEAL